MWGGGTCQGHMSLTPDDATEGREGREGFTHRQHDRSPGDGADCDEHRVADPCRDPRQPRLEGEAHQRTLAEREARIQWVGLGPRGRGHLADRRTPEWTEGEGEGGRSGAGPGAGEHTSFSTPPPTPTSSSRRRARSSTPAGTWVGKGGLRPVRKRSSRVLQPINGMNGMELG